MIILTYVAMQNLPSWQTNVGAKKIDGLALVTYSIVIARYLL